MSKLIESVPRQPQAGTVLPPALEKSLGWIESSELFFIAVLSALLVERQVPPGP